MIIIALDVDTREKALGLVDSLKGQVSYFKIGMELFNSQGPDILARVKERGVKVFLDLKFHDIPNTVASASKVAVKQGVDMFNVHASGGSNMLRKTVEAVREQAESLNLKEIPKVLGVTLLTSLNQEALEKELGVSKLLKDQVVQLAALSQEGGLDGVVASPQEVEIIRKKCGPDFLIVTPGVRPAWASRDDQERIFTPQRAVQAGSSYLVIGRPVTGAPDPREALDRIKEEISSR